MKTREEKVEAIIEGWVAGADREMLIDYVRFSMRNFYDDCSDEEVSEYFGDAISCGMVKEPKYEVKYGEDHED